MGGDGHIGSIFPEAGIESNQSIGKHLMVVKLIGGYPIKVKDRIAVKLDYLAESDQVGLLLTGPGKCQMMEALHKLTGEEKLSNRIKMNKPIIQLLQNKKTNISVYLDTNSLCNTN